MAETVTATPAAPAAATETVPTETKTEAAPEQRFKVKVDGKDVDVPLSELQKHYGLDKASQKRMQDAAAKEKEVNSLLAKLREDPEAYFKFIEKDPEDFAIKKIAARHKKLLEEEEIRALSPEQRESRELKEKVSQLEKEKADEKAALRTVKVDNAKQQIVSAVISTLETFPEKYRKNDALAMQVFAHWEHAVENAEELQRAGVKIGPEYIRDRVLQAMRGLSTDFLSESKDDEIEAMVPPAALAKLKAKIREQMIEEGKKGIHPTLTQDPKVRSTKTEPDKPRMSPNRLLRNITLGTH